MAPPVPCSTMRLRGGLAAVEDADEVDVDRPLPRLPRLVDDRPGLVVAAGVVHEHVEAAAELGGLGDARRGRVRVGDVEVERLGPVAAATMAAGHPAAPASSMSPITTWAPGRGQQLGDALADPRRRAGHQRGPAVEREQLPDRWRPCDAPWRGARGRLDGQRGTLLSARMGDARPPHRHRQRRLRRLVQRRRRRAGAVLHARRHAVRRRQRPVRRLAGHPRLLRQGPREVGRPRARARRVLGERQRPRAPLPDERHRQRPGDATGRSSSAGSGRST